jgi:hypothetical protein
VTIRLTGAAAAACRSRRRSAGEPAPAARPWRVPARAQGAGVRCEAEVGEATTRVLLMDASVSAETAETAEMDEKQVSATTLRGPPLTGVGWAQCAREDSNLHGELSPQGPQPCASTNSATGAEGASIATGSAAAARRPSGLASVHPWRYSTNTRSFQATVHPRGESSRHGSDQAPAGDI